MDHRRQVAKNLGTALDKTDRRQRDVIGGVAVQPVVVDRAHDVAFASA